MTAHFVYRVFDADERLIYVGCTRNLFMRLRTHEANTWWAYQAAKVTAKVYPDKWSGLLAEREAIRTERPRWNLFHRGQKETWSESDYVDYVTAALNLSEPNSPSRIKRLKNVARHYRNRFGRDFPLDIPAVAAKAAS